VLLSEDNQDHIPKSLLLKGSSLHGPLELEIPITFLPRKGKTIHQLAARHIIRELEENRGWIFHASNHATGKKLGEDFEGRFPDIVEHEAVKLGIQHQITGKWTSFVALDADTTSGPKDNLIEMGVIDAASAHRQGLRASGQPDVFRAKKARRKKVSGGAVKKSRRSRQCYEEAEESDEDMGFALMDDDPPARAAPPVSRPTVAPWQQLVNLQCFDGRWVWSKEIVELFGVNRERVANATVESLSDDILATITAIAYLQKKYLGDKDTWIMIADKAEEWIRRTVDADTYLKLREDISVFF